MSLPVAKNAMRRAIAALYCRPLRKQDKDKVWQFFDSRCAYCDREVHRSLRDGHMDHLDCSATGGGNYIRNRVLACKECNGNEKREGNWAEFLKSKCPDAATLRKRKEKIVSWQQQFKPLPPIVLSPEAKAARVALDAAITNFEKRFVRFRKLMRDSHQ